MGHSVPASANIGSAFTAPEHPQLMPRTRSSRIIARQIRSRTLNFWRISHDILISPNFLDFFPTVEAIDHLPAVQRPEFVPPSPVLPPSPVFETNPAAPVVATLFESGRGESTGLTGTAPSGAPRFVGHCAGGRERPSFFDHKGGDYFCGRCVRRPSS
jgi:hypothetical protein